MSDQDNSKPSPINPTAATAAQAAVPSMTYQFLSTMRHNARSAFFRSSAVHTGMLHTLTYYKLVWRDLHLFNLYAIDDSMRNQQGRSDMRH
jgi:hypothetical protein